MKFKSKRNINRLAKNRQFDSEFESLMSVLFN